MSQQDWVVQLDDKRLNRAIAIAKRIQDKPPAEYPTELELMALAVSFLHSKITTLEAENERLGDLVEKLSRGQHEDMMVWKRLARERLETNTKLRAENERHGYEIETRDTCIQQLRDENTKLQEQVKVYREALETVTEHGVLNVDTASHRYVRLVVKQALNQDTEGKE